MNDLVRLNALRAAARVALGITALCPTALTGCGGTATPSSGEAYYTGTEGSPPATSSDPGPPAQAPAHAATADAECDGSTPAPSDCTKLLGDTTADPAYAEMLDYRSEAPASMPPLSPDLRACCDAELSGETRWTTPHRWLCCNVQGDGKSFGPEVATACTPWGPPVPPSMTWGIA